MAVAGRGTMDVHDTSDEIRGQCDMCEDEMSRGYCAECEINMCNPCFNLHLKSKKCRHHVLQEGSSIDSKTETAQYKICCEHGQAVKLFCTSHEVFGCGECMLIGHKDCKWVYLIEESKRFQESGELDSMLTEIDSLTNTNEELKTIINSLEDKNIALDDIIVNKIESCARSVVEAIGAAKMSAIEATRQRTDKNKEIIAKNKSTLETLSSKLSELTNGFAISKQPYEVFMLAVESKSTIAAIRDTLNRFDSKHIISEFEFESSKNLEKLLAGDRPLGWFTDDETELDDFEEDYKAACERNEILQEAIKRLDADLKNKTLTIETLELNNKRLDADLKSKNSKLETLERNNEKLENEIRTLKNASGEDKEIGLSCGHRGRVDQLSENRTIKCIVCNTVFGDQPPGTMTTATPERLGAIEITFQFPDGIQSKMNRNPGTRYTGTTKTGFLLDNTDSNDVLAMLKTAFNRNLVFTLNDRGEIVSGVVEVFTEYPWRGWSWLTPGYVEYIKRVKQQLADVGINQ